jgi:predicted permease
MWSDIVFRVRAIFRRDRFEDQLDDEVRFHYQEQVDQFLAAGMAPDEARRHAQLAVGGMGQVKEECREAWGVDLIHSALQDVRFAFRNLRKTPAFTAVATATLALGIGASSAIISVVDAAMLRPLPYPDPEQLVYINPEIVLPDGSTSRPATSMADMRAWQEATDIVSHVAGYGLAFGGLIVDDAEPERISVLQMTEDYLPLHGITPILGRGFDRDDMDPGGEAIGLLGHRYWQSSHAGRTDIVGETLRLNDGTLTIVGVLPAGFHADTEVFRPLRVEADQINRRGTGRVAVYARLRPGVTPEQAADALSQRTVPGENAREARAIVTSLLEQTTGRYDTTVRMLMGAGALILLIACVNVAGLLLARGAVRGPELATRSSLGAGRWRLVRQLLTENLVLAMAGAGVGIALAWLALDTIVASIPMSIPGDATTQIDLRVLAGTLVLLVPTTLIFGLIPALKLSGGDLSSQLAQGYRPAASAPMSRRNNQFLVGAELALAVILVVGAGLMIRTYAQLTAVDLGFEPEGLLTMEVLPVGDDPALHDAYYPELVDRIRRLPGVEAAGGVDVWALGDMTSFSGVEANDRSSFVTVFRAMPGYFETIGARLLDGRFPTAADHAGGANLAVISQTAAADIFPRERAVGQQFSYAGTETPFTVAGVISDLRHGGPLDDASRVSAQVYLPFGASAATIRRNLASVIVLRISESSPVTATALRDTAEGIGPRVLVESVRSADEWFGDRVRTPRQRTVLLGMLGGLGFLLALVGVFGMTAYAIACRRSEIGVRMAFGARPSAVVAIMLRDTAVAVAVGTFIGLAGAAAATRLIESFLFGIESTDPTTFIAVAVGLATAGLIAALIPALRATRVDPSVTLRSQV